MQVGFQVDPRITDLLMLRIPSHLLHLPRLHFRLYIKVPRGKTRCASLAQLNLPHSFQCNGHTGKDLCWCKMVETYPSITYHSDIFAHIITRNFCLHSLRGKAHSNIWLRFRQDGQLLPVCPNKWLPVFTCLDHGALSSQIKPRKGQHRNLYWRV